MSSEIIYFRPIIFHLVQLKFELFFKGLLSDRRWIRIDGIFCGSEVVE